MPWLFRMAANSERRVNVDYMMRRNGDSWLISDIYLDGAISEVAISKVLRMTGSSCAKRPLCPRIQPFFIDTRG